MFHLCERKLILILSILLISTNVVSLNGGDAVSVAKNLASYEGCIPVMKKTTDCKKLFYCVPANASQFRAPIIRPIEFSLVGDCKALLKDRSRLQKFKMKVSINGFPQPAENSQIVTRKKVKTYIGEWSGGFTNVDIIKTFQNFEIYIYLQWAADGPVTLPTYSIYFKCEIDKGTSDFARFCT